MTLEAVNIANQLREVRAGLKNTLGYNSRLLNEAAETLCAQTGQIESLSDKCVMYDIQLASLRKETGELLARANIAETKLRAAHVVIANLEARAKNVQGPFITREPGDTP